MRWRQSFSTSVRLLSRGPLNIDFTTQALRGGWGFPTPPSSVPAWARPVRGGRGLLKGPRCQSLPITPASFTTLLLRSQPRPDPGEEGGIYPPPSRHSPLCELTFDHPPSSVPAQARPGREERRLAVAPFNGGAA